MLSQQPKAFFYQKQPLRVPEERNVRPCEELALPQPTKFGFRSQEDEQTSCYNVAPDTSIEHARTCAVRFVIRLRVKICQLLRNTTFRGHNSKQTRPSPRVYREWVWLRQTSLGQLSLAINIPRASIGVRRSFSSAYNHALLRSLTRPSLVSEGVASQLAYG